MWPPGNWSLKKPAVYCVDFQFSVPKRFRQHGMAEGAKRAILDWARRVTKDYPRVKIDNLLGSFQDGLALCAIVHHYLPEHKVRSFSSVRAPFRHWKLLVLKGNPHCFNVIFFY
jgi:hypothetical protein